MKCEYCNNEVPAGKTKCPACGAPAPAQPEQPQPAAQPAPGGQGYYQGQAPVIQVFASPAAAPGAAPAAAPAAPASAKSRTVFILLAVFLGSLGIHNFYIGRTLIGVVQLLITLISFGALSMVSWIWAIIECIIIKQDSKGALLS